MTIEPPVGASRARAWTVSVLSAVLALILLTVVHLSFDASETASYRFGQMLPLAVISGVLGLVTASTQPRWWLAPPVVIAVAAVGYAVLYLPDDLESDRAARQTSEKLTHVLGTPASAAGWTLVETDETAANGRAYLQRTEQTGAQDAVYGEYQREDGTELLAFMGFTPFDDLREEVIDSPTDAVRDVLLGSSGADEVVGSSAGPLGGGLACVTAAPRLPGGMVLCGWVDGSTIGQVTFSVSDLTADEAAALTREFRAAVTLER